MNVETENKLAAEWLLNFHERKKSYLEATECFNVLAAIQYTGMPHGSGTSNPTASKGVILSDIENQKEWIIVIERTEKTLSEKKIVYLNIRRQAELMEFKHKRGRPGWVDYTQAQYATWYEHRYGKGFVPGKQTMVDWWSEIVNVAVRIAIRQGIL